MIAGTTTFLTMAYIIIINPVILSAAGMPFGPVMVATILVAGIATIVTGLYANRPFCMAPYMGENAFFAYSVVIALSVTWMAALGAVFLAGLMFVILSFSGLRRSLINSIPRFLSASWAIAIGLFIMFIGLANAGIAVPGIPGAPVKIGNFDAIEVQLTIFGILLTLVLYAKKVVGAVLIGTVVMLMMGFVLGAMGLGTQLPHTIPDPFGPIPDWGEVAFKMDVAGALNATLIPIILVMFIMDFLDTAGTIMGLGAKAGFLDKDGKLPEVEKVMQVDAASTAMAGAFGTTTSGAFVESATGIEAGGRTGLTAVTAGILFLVMIAFTPFFAGLPIGFLQIVAAPALVVVGITMFTPITSIDFTDMAQAIPCVLTIAFMLFTFNIGFGLAIGLVTYPLVMLAMGRAKEVPRLMYALAVLGVVLFLIYPYHS
jgi:AGZA family xanthine/uracil permease-like MFS transporter